MNEIVGFKSFYVCTKRARKKLITFKELGERERIIHVDCLFICIFFCFGWNTYHNNNG